MLITARILRFSWPLPGLVRVLVPAQGSARQLQLGLLSYSASRSHSSPKRGFDQKAADLAGTCRVQESSVCGPAEIRATALVLLKKPLLGEG